jgi:hypothetical protein
LFRRCVEQAPRTALFPAVVGCSGVRLGTSGPCSLRWRARPWPLSGLDNTREVAEARKSGSTRKEAPWVRYRCDIKGRISPDHLWNILLDASECLCSDPRDKVFAVLGLINTWTDRPILAHYSRTVEGGYIGIATYLGKLTGRFGDVLGLAAEQRRSVSRHPLPSWVPDWSHVSITAHRSNYLSRSLAYDGLTGDMRYLRFPFPSSQLPVGDEIFWILDIGTCITKATGTSPPVAGRDPRAKFIRTYT